MGNTRSDRPGVIAPPPLLYLGALALGLILHVLFPLRPLPPLIARSVGALLVARTVPFMLRARRLMLRAGTNVNPYKPATAIVQAGPFRVSRNPLYLSLTLLYVGLALLVNTLWPFLLLPIVIGVMITGVVEREERYLEAKFGEEYRVYAASVRRWL